MVKQSQSKNRGGKNLLEESLLNSHLNRIKVMYMISLMVLNRALNNWVLLFWGLTKGDQVHQLQAEIAIVS